VTGSLLFGGLGTLFVGYGVYHAYRERRPRDSLSDSAEDVGDGALAALRGVLTLGRVLVVTALLAVVAVLSEGVTLLGAVAGVFAGVPVVSAAGGIVLSGYGALSGLLPTSPGGWLILALALLTAGVVYRDA
jgi:hypothetical protein